MACQFFMGFEICKVTPFLIGSYIFLVVNWTRNLNVISGARVTRITRVL